MPYKDPVKRREADRIRNRRRSKMPKRIGYLKEWRKNNGKKYWKDWYTLNKERRAKYIKLWMEKKSPVYLKIHGWVHSKRGKPPVCVDCGKKGTYDVRSNGQKVWNIQWSNTDGKYRKVLKDFEGRCHSCHVRYDFQLRS